MAYFNLIVSHITDNKLRTIYTCGAIVVAFVLFGLLMPIDRVFNSRVIFADADRLVLTNKTSIMRPLPVAYQDILIRDHEVKFVGHFTFFGAFYQNEEQGIPTIVTDPELFPDMVDEIEFRNPTDLQNWFDTPTGVAVGRELADQYNWSVGDIIPVFSSIYRRTDGSNVWTFTISTIFDGAYEYSNTNSMVVNYDYFDRARSSGEGTVGWYAIRIKENVKADEFSARIDELFSKYESQTRTTTEKMFAQSFLRQVGDFGFMISIALTLVFWSVVLVTANTMAQSVRQRFKVIGILKTLGLTNPDVFKLVLLESLTLVVMSGLVGLGIAAIAIVFITGSTNQLLGYMSMELSDLGIGLGLMVVIALITGLFPALMAARQQISHSLQE